MVSYNQVVKENKAFATAHQVIKNFGNGERWQLNAHDQLPTFKYPLMFLEDIPMSSQEKEFIYSFRVWFVTRVEAPTDRGAEILFTEYAQAKSSMISCAQDLIAYWVQQTDYPTLDIDRSISLETFIDQEPDKITGCYIELRFREAFDYDNCIIPVTGMPTPPSSDVTVTVNGESFFTLTCGGSGNVVVKNESGDSVGSKVGNEWIVPDGGGGSFTYDLYLDNVDTGQNITVDGTDITINIS